MSYCVMFIHLQLIMRDYFLASALESQQTGDYTPVIFPLSAMGDVVVEVLIPPGGTELLPRNRHKQLFIEVGLFL